MSRFNVRKVAVLGAGVMGAQIAAHLVNVKVPVVLFDLPAKDKDGGGALSSTFSKNGIVTKAVEGLEETQARATRHVAGRCGIDWASQLRRASASSCVDCDLIIEAIAERMDWKLDLYKKIAPFIAPHAIVAIEHLWPVDHQAVRSAAGRNQAAFLRHPLLQPAALYGAGRVDCNTPTTAARASWTQLEAFVTSATWARAWSVPRIRPNFIANRVGIAGMLLHDEGSREIRPDL